MLQIARSLFHNTVKNILDISVSLEYFICTGDGYYSAPKVEIALFWTINFHMSFSLMGSKEARFAKLIHAQSIFRNWWSFQKPRARDIPAFYSAFLSQPLKKVHLANNHSWKLPQCFVQTSWAIWKGLNPMPKSKQPWVPALAPVPTVILYFWQSYCLWPLFDQISNSDLKRSPDVLCSLISLN